MRIDQRPALAELFDPRAVALILSARGATLPAWAAGLRDAFEQQQAKEPRRWHVCSLDDKPVDAANSSAGVRSAKGPALVAPAVAAEPETAPEGFELAVIATPCRDVPMALHRAAALGATAAIVIDRDADAEAQARMLSEARRHGIRLLGPGSMGVMRPHRNLNASRLGTLPPPGNVALVSQSGVLGGALLDWARDSGLGFSTVVSLGAEIDVELAHVLDFLNNDARTKAVVLYMEAVRDSRAFMSALRTLATVKPVVVLKGGRGRSTAGTRTHSGALVAADAVYTAALRRCGAVQVRLFTQLFTAVRVLAARQWPQGRRLAIMANGQGPALLAADQASLSRLSEPDFQPATLDRLGQILPVVDSHHPLVIDADAPAEQYAEVVKALASDRGLDALLVLIAPLAGLDTDELAIAVAEAAAAAAKSPSGGAAFGARPVIVAVPGGAPVAGVRARLAELGISAFRTPEAAVDAFATVATFQQNQKLLLQTPRPLSGLDAPDLEGARALLSRVHESGRDMLSEIESKQLLTLFGIQVATTEMARDADEAVAMADRIGYPVVLKILSPDISHKSEVGGVALDVRDAPALRLRYDAMMADVRRAAPQAHIQGVAVQPMVRARFGRELYVGVSRNRQFGPVIAFGAGGTAVELTRDTTLEFPPLNDFLARSMVARTRIAAALGASRAVPAIDHEALVRVLVRVSEMVCELPQIAEMDINPLVCSEQGAVAVDARVLLGEPAVRAGSRYGHMAILPYPAHLEREHQMRDGRPYLVRPIRGEDAERLQEFMRGLSEESRYFRFISSLRELPPRMLVRYTQIDYDRELAMVAVVPSEQSAAKQSAGVEGGSHDGAEACGSIIGVARFLLNDERDSCEFAVAIADDYQAQGLGSTLMRSIIRVARFRGYERMIGYVLAINAPMLALMRRLGFVIGTDPDDETMKRVVLSLQGEEAALSDPSAVPASP